MIEAIHGVIGAYSNFVPVFAGVQNTQLIALVTVTSCYFHFQKGFVRDILQVGKTATDFLFYYILSIGLVCIHRLYLIDQPDLVSRVKLHDSTEDVVDPLNSHPTDFWSRAVSGPVWLISFVTYPIAIFISWTVSTVMIAIMISITIKAAHLTAPDNVLIAGIYEVTKSISDGVTSLSMSIYDSLKRTVNHEAYDKTEAASQKHTANTPICSATSADNQKHTLNSVLTTVEAIHKDVTAKMQESKTATDNVFNILNTVQGQLQEVQEQGASNSERLTTLGNELEDIAGDASA